MDALRERTTAYRGATFREHELTAAWLLGRLPGAVLWPWRTVRVGRAGRGPGPDVREAAFALPSGAILAGDVEVHLRASDFMRHGHGDDPAYRRVVLHLVWEDDEGGTLCLPGGGTARTVAVADLLGGRPERLHALLRLGPTGTEPCAAGAGAAGPAPHRDALRRQGERRLAERVWHAGALVARRGWDGAWAELLDRALERSAGRRAEGSEQRALIAAAIGLALGPEPLLALARLARDREPARLIQALRAPSLGGHVLGVGRAAEVGWNAALPLLAALAAVYQDVGLARDVAGLVASWPAPRPYGRTLALSGLLGVRPQRAVEAQGLLHTQELWCERGGCGMCPFSATPAHVTNADA